MHGHTFAFMERADDIGSRPEDGATLLSNLTFVLYVSYIKLYDFGI